MRELLEPFARLLLPVDTVETFERVVPLAGWLIRSMGIPASRVDLLHVVVGSFLSERFKSLDLAAGQGVSDRDLQRLRDDYLADTAVPLLERSSAMIERAAGCGPFGRLIRDGDPVKVIGALCRENRYSTLIMGRRRLMSQGGRQTGSVTAGLLHRHAGATVYLVGNEPGPADHEPFARCLIGIDGSAESRKAVREAGMILSRFNSRIERVLLVHVLDQSCYYNEDGVPCSKSGLVGQRALEEASTTLIEAGIAPGLITTVIHFGRPGTVLVEEVLACDATMIFLGKRDRSQMAQFYLGSVCTDIVQNCRNRILALVG